jgi:hypothetical protein
VDLHGNVQTTPSPVNNGIFLDGKVSWLDLRLQSNLTSCLTDPFTCSQELTVATLIKATYKSMLQEGEIIQSEVFGPYGNVSEGNVNKFDKYS